MGGGTCCYIKDHRCELLSVRLDIWRKNLSITFPPSTQLLRVGIIFEAVSVVLVILAFIPFPSLTVNAILFYITIIVGSFTSVIAFICAIVGLIRFVRHRIANIVLAAVSVLINPVTVVLADALLNSNG